MKEYRYYLIDIDRTLWDFDTNSEHAIWHLIERHPHLDEAIRRMEGENTHYKHLFFEGSYQEVETCSFLVHSFYLV